MHRQGPSAHTARWRRVSRSPGRFPASPPRVRAPMAARPMATPAWGIRANPRYLRISLGLCVTREPQTEPGVFSYDSGKKNTELQWQAAERSPTAAEVPVSASSWKPSPEWTKNSRRIGGGKVVQLLEQLFILRQVDVGSPHGHAAKKRRYVQAGADAAEGEEQGDRDQSGGCR